MPGAVLAWRDAWAQWPSPGKITMVVRAWPRVGKQQLPDALLVDGPDTVAAIAGMTDMWIQARTNMGAAGTVCDAIDLDFEALHPIETFLVVLTLGCGATRRRDQCINGSIQFCRGERLREKGVRTALETIACHLVVRIT